VPRHRGPRLPAGDLVENGRAGRLVLQHADSNGQRLGVRRKSHRPAKALRPMDDLACKRSALPARRSRTRG
jgi:hypothetical protein